jgi:hypothetical protein
MRRCWRVLLSPRRGATKGLYQARYPRADPYSQNRSRVPGVPYRTHMRRLALSVAAALAVVACDSAPSNRPSTTSTRTAGADQTTREAPSLPRELEDRLLPASYLGREGTVVALELPGGFQTTVDLRTTATFDCRQNCLVGVGIDLQPTSSAETYCFWQHGSARKLWVNRPECPNGVPR